MNKGNKIRPLAATSGFPAASPASQAAAPSNSSTVRIDTARDGSHIDLMGYIAF